MSDKPPCELAAGDGCACHALNPEHDQTPPAPQADNGAVLAPSTVRHVVHCKRAKHDVYIGRPSKWGNPFEIGKDGDRETVICKYREWVVTQPRLMAALPELRGKVLGCWCAPQACHGDVLVSLANARTELPPPDSDGGSQKKESNQ